MAKKKAAPKAPKLTAAQVWTAITEEQLALFQKYNHSAAYSVKEEAEIALLVHGAISSVRLALMVRNIRLR